VVHAASRLLPHYVPATTGPLRRQPLVHKALQLTQLLQDTGAAEGRSPWVGAGGIVQKRPLIKKGTSLHVHVYSAGANRRHEWTHDARGVTEKCLMLCTELLIYA